MTNIYSQISNKNAPTPQCAPIFGEKQIQNNTGGYVYEINPMEKLLRFLILGTEGGTYYVSERKLTEDNAKSIVELIQTNGQEVVRTTVEISTSGRAPKNDPAVFVMALAATYGDAETKKLVYNSIDKVCRIGTHLFHFVEMVNNMRKWSGGLRRGVSNFYLNKSADQLAVQLLKYRQRDGWTHKDVLRLCHAKTKVPEIHSLFSMAVGKETEKKHPLVIDFERLQSLKDINEIKKIIVGNKMVTWEMLPTDCLKHKGIWDALLPNMPLTAMLRNISKMASMEMFSSNLNQATKILVNKLSEIDALRKQKIHPFQVLFALKIYNRGVSMDGKTRWQKAGAITSALDDTFYACFQNVEPTNQNVFIGMDISGSMGAQMLNSPLCYAEAACAMAMLALRTEPYCEVMGFADRFIKLHLTKNDTIDEVFKKIMGHNFGRTNCALPMIYAMQNKIPVDIFQIITDNETNTGDIHPSQALKQYREKFNKKAKLVVMGMAAVPFTIADPNDTGMMDCVGFDATVPVLINRFAKGF